MLENDIIEIAKYLLPVLSAALVWLLNERSKRKSEQYQRREMKYFLLIKNIDGFYANTKNKEEKIQEFMNELNQCWLYCPDITIKKAYAFLETVKVGNTSTEKERENALGELMIEIRNDLSKNKPFRKSKLTSMDFKIQSIS